MVAMSCSPGTTGIGWRRGSGRGYARPDAPAFAGLRTGRDGRGADVQITGGRIQAPKADPLTSWRALRAPRMMNSRVASDELVTSPCVFQTLLYPPKCGVRDGLGGCSAVDAAA